RKIVAQRATKLYKNKENVNFYIISIEIDVYSLIRNVYVPDSFICNDIYKMQLILHYHLLYILIYVRD
ncbi:hypothetical protein, partial [Staphylococcus edaphicus]|uniref:hypothetical protein n=1 Tax=Staphylococcus edaphicus TaxID=1955013 RepID=UPI001EE6A7FC